MIVFSYMSIYFLFIFFQKINKKKYQKLSIFILIIFSISIVLLNYGKIIGTDYETYNRLFNNLLLQEKIPSFYIKDSGWLLKVYFYFMGKFYSNFKLTIILLILFHNSLIYYFFKKYSYNNLFYFTLLTYFCFFYTQNSFNALKQLVAICFFTLSLEKAFKKKIIKYYFLLIIGALFHSLVLFFSPVYFFVGSKIKIKKIILIFIFTLILIIFINNYFIDIIKEFFKDNQRYYQYFSNKKTTFFNFVNFFEVYIPLFILFFLDFKCKVRKSNEKNKNFINLYYIFSLVYLLTLIDKIFGYRFVMFFSIIFSVIYPYIFFEFFKFLKLEKYFSIFYGSWLFIFLFIRYIRIFI